VEDPERPIRVIVHYATAAVDADGTVLFAEDIYTQDPALDRALTVSRQ
jgi:murein L,D-transpeptidase YcbB/YkuD